MYSPTSEKIMLNDELMFYLYNCGPTVRWEFLWARNCQLERSDT